MLTVSTARYIKRTRIMKRYHHSDLRSALLDAALDEMKEKGPRHFSLRQVAARAGVSHAAPYRHFPDKESLLAALVLRGMKGLTDCLRSAALEPAVNARGRLSRLGRAYIAFARRNPQLLSLMFSGIGFTAVNASRAVNLQVSDYDAFGELEIVVRACQEEGSLDPRRDSGILSLLIWSTVHGLSILYTEDVIPHMVAERNLPEGLAEAELLKALDELFAAGGGRE